jgi:alkaline phosphatase
MTMKALDILSQDKNGFFLMVEGGQIDWAGHANFFAVC